MLARGRLARPFSQAKAGIRAETEGAYVDLGISDKLPAIRGHIRQINATS